MKRMYPVMMLLAAQAAVAADSIDFGTVIDLSHSYDAETVYWPTASGFELKSDFKGTAPGGYYYEANTLCTAEHGGTHLDAPIHFAEGGRHTDEIPLDRLIGPAVVVDVSTRAAGDRDYQVSISDFEAWEGAHGRLPDGIIVLLRTGFSRFWPDAAAYLGTAARGAEAIAGLHFPGLDPEAARWLVAERNIHAIGIDTASIDHGPSTGFESHRTLFAAGIPAFENVAQLERLPASGFSVIALPMKIRGGSGGPLRIVAIMP